MLRALLLLALASCGSSTKPPAPPPPPAAPAPPSAPAAAAQVFAEADPGFAFLDPDRQTKLDAALGTLDAAIEDELKRQDLAGATVGVVIDGELAYAKGFGVVDLATKAKPDADTVYRIGSITKSFTALAALALRDDGVLQLDDPLTRWLPEAAGLVYPTRDARPLTLRQLLNHTAGLPRQGAYDVEHTPDEATILKSLAGFRLDTAPGTVHSYSNMGFQLLGLAAGRAAHLSYEELIARRIFGPLGMTSTRWDYAGIPAGKLAPAYQSGPKGPAPTLPSRRGAAGASGAIFSTVRDMARYAAFQLSAYPPRSDADTGPLRRATVREAHSTGVLIGGRAFSRPGPPGEPSVELHAMSYGNGWLAERTCELDDLVWHNGAVDSYRADLRFLTSRGVAVIALSNFENADPSAIADRVIGVLAKTGALARRTPRPAPAFAGALRDFLAVYNQWNEAAYKAMLEPARPPVVDAEKAELAGYHQLHGACTTGTVLDVGSASSARFKVACERGSFVVELGLGATGKIAGFAGESRDLAAPADPARTAAAFAALIKTWNPKAYTAALPRATRDAAASKPRFDDLRAEHGACTVKAAVHVVDDWQFELACERGGGLILGFVRDPKDKAITAVGVRPLASPDLRCATR